MKSPKQIIVEVTQRCNLRCRYCPRNELNARLDMSFELFTSIIDRIDFPTVVIPWMNGEPLLHPRYAEMIKYVTSRRLPCYITTNGMLWNEELFQHITEKTSCYQLIFSLDGLLDDGSRSIEKARPGSNRKTIKDNIFKLLSLKHAKSAALNIATKICMRGQDWQEVEGYIDFWLRNGVDYVCVGRNLTDDATPGMRTSPCQYFDNNFMVIRADGGLRACAYNDAVVNQEALPLGRVEANGRSLIEIYNSQPYEELRASQDGGRYPGPCWNCGFAYTGMGFEGVVKLRDPQLIQQDLYFHQDYYNMFFSLRKDWKASRYYERGKG